MTDTNTRTFAYGLKTMIKLLHLSLLALTFTLSSCANKVIWNEADGEAYLVDYGYHSSLVLQDEEGVYWEYTYGDWEWFAMNRSQWWRLPVTLFWPTTSTLARGEYSSRNSLDQHLRTFKTELFAFEVEPKKAQALIEKLNQKFEVMRDSEGEFYQPLYRLSFVPLSSESYHLFRNCNHIIVSWLEQLGVQVDGVHLFSKWKFEQID